MKRFLSKRKIEFLIGVLIGIAIGNIILTLLGG